MSDYSTAPAPDVLRHNLAQAAQRIALQDGGRAVVQPADLDKAAGLLFSTGTGPVVLTDPSTAPVDTALDALGILVAPAVVSGGAPGGATPTVAPAAPDSVVDDALRGLGIGTAPAPAPAPPSLSERIGKAIRLATDAAALRGRRLTAAEHDAIVAEAVRLDR